MKGLCYMSVGSGAVVKFRVIEACSSLMSGLVYGVASVDRVVCMYLYIYTHVYILGRI